MIFGLFTLILAFQPAQAQSNTTNGFGALLSKVTRDPKDLMSQFDPERCDRQKAKATNANDYCDKLASTVCDSQEPIRYDATGANSNDGKSLINDYFAKRKEFLNQALTDLQKDGSVPENAFKPVDSSMTANDCSVMFMETIVDQGSVTSALPAFKEKMTGKCEIGDNDAFLKLGGSSALKQKVGPLIVQQKDFVQNNPQIAKIKNDYLPAAKQILQDMLKANMPAGAARDKIMKRVSDLQVKACANDSLQKPSGSYLSPDTNEVNLCLNQLGGCSSAFCAMHVLAHEMSHALDTCGYFKEVSDVDPVDRAAISEDEVMQKHPFGQVLKCMKENNTMKMTNREPKKSVCGDQRMMEASSDIIGNEIVARYMKKNRTDLNADDMRRGFANAKGCGKKKESPFGTTDHHPSDAERIELIRQNSTARKLMNCPDLPKKCDFK